MDKVIERKGIVLDPPEKKRTYIYSNGHTIVVPGVTAVEVSFLGNHRLETVSGLKYIVAPGWAAIELDVEKLTF